MMLSPRSSSAWLLATILAFTVVDLTSCDSASGLHDPVHVVRETEPNDTPASADLLQIGQTGIGELNDASEVDYWKVFLPSETTATIELFAARFDQEDWDSQDCVARLTLYGEDGTSKLLEHDFSGVFSAGWSWGKHDLDIPRFRVTDSGTYYLAISVDGVAMVNGDYALLVEVSSEEPPQFESEPLPPGGGTNDTAATAQAFSVISSPATVHGHHVDGESDYFKFSLSGPRIVRLEICAFRNGVADGDDDYYDPALDLIDTDETSLLASNDDAFFSDPGIQYSIDTPGTYFVRVHESPASAGDAPYFLTVFLDGPLSATETEPNDTTGTANAFASRISGTIGAGDTDVFTFAGNAGEMVRLQVFDDSNFQGATDSVSVRILGTDGVTPLDTGGGGSFNTLTSILQSDGDYFVEITPSAGSTDYHLQVSVFYRAAVETEPNDTIATANPTGIAITHFLEIGMAGVIDPPGDVDYFRFGAEANRLVSFKVYASRGPTTSDGFPEFSGHGSTLTPSVRVFHSNGGLVERVTGTFANVSGESVTDPLPTTSVSFVDAAGGPYFVEIGDALGGGGPSAYYVVEIEQ